MGYDEVGAGVLVVFGTTWVAFIGCASWGVGASWGLPIGRSAAADDPARAAMRLSVVSGQWSVVATLVYLARSLTARVSPTPDR
ncbi:MAG: hypothetical protein WAU30_10575 [Propionicimonas sp.]